MHHLMNTALVAAFLALCTYATHESWKRGRHGWALFCMFFVGYNAHSLLRLL